jgi:hypothetical protein
MKNLILTGIFAIPSLDLHNRIAPQRSIKVPSTKTLDSFAIYKQQIEYFLFKSQQKKDVQRKNCFSVVFFRKVEANSKNLSCM